MLHGKKGFDRLVYTCKNVLNRPVTWLVCNASSSGKCIYKYFSYGSMLLFAYLYKLHLLDLTHY